MQWLQLMVWLKFAFISLSEHSSMTTLVVQVKQSVGCICLCVRTVTCKLDDFRPRYLTSWFILTLVLSSSNSNVKVMGQSSRLQEESGRCDLSRVFFQLLVC